MIRRLFLWHSSPGLVSKNVLLFSLVTSCSEVRDSETQQRLGQSLKHRVESYMTNISQPAAADAKAPAAESKAPSEAVRNGSLLPFGPELDAPSLGPPLW